MKTEASFADIGPFEKMVSFEISSVDLNHAMNRASRRISREVNIAGFRPGRAPRRLVENRVGLERIKNDALDDLVPARMGRILSETDVNPVVPPLLESVTDTANGAVKVEVRVTTWPRIESVPPYRGKEIEVPDVPAVSEEVDARLTQLRHMYAPLQTVDRAVRKGDFVVIDMTVKEEGRLIEALALDGFSYEVGSARLTTEIDESLVGRQAADEIELDAPLPEWFRPETRDGNGPGAGGGDPSWDDAGETATGSYQIRIAEVQSRSLPDLDDEWALEYTGHDSLEELKEEIRVEVEEQRNTTHWEMLVAETLKEMTADLQLDLPERLEAAQTELLFRNHLTSLENADLDYATYLERTGLDHEQFVQGLRDRAVAGLKARVLIEGVIEEEGLTVEDTEVWEFLHELAREAEDPEQFRRDLEEGAHSEQIRSDMLRSRAQAFMALHVQPVGPSGRPVQIEAPAWVKAWFHPSTETAEILDTEGEAGEALYEAEVIDDPNPD